MSNWKKYVVNGLAGVGAATVVGGIWSWWKNRNNDEEEEEKDEEETEE